MNGHMTLPDLKQISNSLDELIPDVEGYASSIAGAGDTLERNYRETDLYDTDIEDAMRALDNAANEIVTLMDQIRDASSAVDAAQDMCRTIPPSFFWNAEEE